MSVCNIVKGSNETLHFNLFLFHSGTFFFTAHCDLIIASRQRLFLIYSWIITDLLLHTGKCNSIFFISDKHFCRRVGLTCVVASVIAAFYRSDSVHCCTTKTPQLHQVPENTECFLNYTPSFLQCFTLNAICEFKIYSLIWIPFFILLIIPMSDRFHSGLIDYPS